MGASPWIIAHRGASADAPDNSLAAFEKAIEVGADMIEFDVRRTKDERLIVFHDDRVKGRFIRELAFDEIVQANGGAPVLLDALLECTAGRIALDVELKEDGYVEHVLTNVRRHVEPEQLLITSFVDDVIAQVNHHEPSIRTGLLVGRDSPERYLRTRISELSPVSRAQACGADFVAPYFRLADLGVLRRADAAGLMCLVWTVNADDRLRRYLHDPRVAGVITDVPARALALRG